MCGIAGAALKSNKIGAVLLEFLKRLEYRGYDSVGEAAIVDGQLVVKKDKGKIDEVEEYLQLSKLEGAVGVGHTRWATHGAPSRENAHPHTDCRNTLAVVHNGIIENFLQIRQELEAKGHTFKSRTDTEVIAHLVEDGLKSTSNVALALRSALSKVEGSYALALISQSEPDKVLCARKESPLLIGLGSEGNYCASDMAAFLALTREIISLEDGQMAVLTSTNVKVMDIESGEEVPKKFITVDWTVEGAIKGGYTHFMLKEIHEQAIAVRNALRTQSIYLELMASTLNRAKKIFMVACGTSYHACLAASYTFSNLAKCAVTPVIASEFAENHLPLTDGDTVILAVSQSGETADTLSAVIDAKERGASILAISNVMGSTLTRLADVYIGQNSGPEIGVAATKTFTAQLSVLAKLATTLAAKRGHLGGDKARALEAAFNLLPDWIGEVVTSQEETVKQIASKYRDKPSFCFLGRGVSVATALEGRLKLLELSYIPAIAYAAGESKHGFISVIERGYPTIFIAPRDEAYSKIIGNVMEMKARGAEVITLTNDPNGEISKLSDEIITLPANIPSPLTPIVFVVPLQLLAYHLAVLKGYDPDFPRNLAKSVTVH